MRKLNIFLFAALIYITANIIGAKNIEAQSVLDNNKLRFGTGAEAS